MKRTQKLVLALSASMVLALGAASPAFADPPPANPGAGTDTACEVVPPAAERAREALDCEFVLPPPPPGR